MLLAALDPGRDALLAEPAFHRRLDLAHDVLAVPALLPYPGLEHAVAPRVEGSKSEIFELDADAPQPEAVCDGGVDVDGLARDAASLVERQRLEGAHVVHPVGELDEHDPQIAGHRHQHLAKVLGLRLGEALEPEMGQLADSVHELGDRVAEPGRDMRLGDRRVLHDVMEEGGDDRLVIEAHLREHLRHLHGMVDVGLARCAALSLVGVGAEQEGPVDPVDLRRLEVATGEAFEIADAEHVRDFSPCAPVSSDSAERKDLLRLFLGENGFRRLVQDGLVHLAVGNLAQRDHRRLVTLVLDEQGRAVGDLACALRGDEHQFESVGDFLDAVFDRDPGHVLLRRRRVQCIRGWTRVVQRRFPKPGCLFVDCRLSGRDRNALHAALRDLP